MQKENAFTLLELIIVVVILGILATIAIPWYGRVVEEQKGRSCKLNMITTFSAWRIYNMREPTDYDPGGGFRTNTQINNGGHPADGTFPGLGTVIEERYFGDDGPDTPGFFMDMVAPNTRLYLWAERLSGNYETSVMSYIYNWNTGAVTKNLTGGPGSVQADTWTLPTD